MFMSARTHGKHWSPNSRAKSFFSQRWNLTKETFLHLTAWRQRDMANNQMCRLNKKVQWFSGVLHDLAEQLAAMPASVLTL